MFAIGVAFTVTLAEADVDVFDWPPAVLVTTQRKYVTPTVDVDGEYVLLVAPLMFDHVLPFTELCHWYERVPYAVVAEIFTLVESPL